MPYFAVLTLERVPHTAVTMSRRHFLKTTAAAALATGFSAFADPSSPGRRIIDTHTHFYDVTRPQGVPWPPKQSPLYRKVLPEDWKAVASPLGVHETVVVEASPWVEDNEWILQLASAEKCIVGFVGNLDPHDAVFAEHLKRFAANPLFRGIRWRGDLVKWDAGQEKVLNAARLLAEKGLSLDVNGVPAALPQVAKLAKEVPELNIIINHVGGAGDPQKLKPEWLENMRLAAACPNVVMKVCGMLEQVAGKGPAAPPMETGYYLPILEPLWESFGPERLLYGSNWPVSDRAAPYASVFRLVSEYFESKGTEALDRYFTQNARRVYRCLDRAQG